MTLNQRLSMFVPAFGLAAALISPANIDDKPKTLADWGVPSVKATTPSLVTDNFQNVKFGQKPTTLKVYNSNGLIVEEYSIKNEAYMVIVKSPSSSKFEIYTSSQGDYFEKVLSREINLQ